MKDILYVAIFGNLARLPTIILHSHRRFELHCDSYKKFNLIISSNKGSQPYTSHFFLIRFHFRLWHINTNKSERRKERTKQLTKRYFAHAFGFCAYSVENICRGVLDTKMNPCRSGRANSIRIRYMWKRRFPIRDKIFSDSKYL